MQKLSRKNYLKNLRRLLFSSSRTHHASRLACAFAIDATLATGKKIGERNLCADLSEAASYKRSFNFSLLQLRARAHTNKRRHLPLDAFCSSAQRKRTLVEAASRRAADDQIRRIARTSGRRRFVAVAF